VDEWVPELIITDIFMAEMDGLEVISAVKKRLPQAKIIAMSGMVAEAALNLLPVAGKMGADRTLHKPVHFAALLEVIYELDQELGRPESGGKN
jgi:CheY-like chemotaxis protein